MRITARQDERRSNNFPRGSEICISVGVSVKEAYNSLGRDAAGVSVQGSPDGSCK